jgi:hypothetical protein
MFIRHGQYGTTFNETKALQCFNESMSWRKKNEVYGNTNSKTSYMNFPDASTKVFSSYRYFKR